MLNIEPMGQSDVSKVAPLFLAESQTRFWESGRPHDRQSAAEMLSGYFQLPSRHWILSWCADVVGYGQVLYSDYLDAWIVSYVVQPDFQGRGIATTFVEEAKRFARAEELERLCASIHPENLASVRVIEKAGFQLLEQSSDSANMLFEWCSLDLSQQLD